jgi:hypothetical protein
MSLFLHGCTLPTSLLRPVGRRAWQQTGWSTSFSNDCAILVHPVRSRQVANSSAGIVQAFDSPNSNRIDRTSCAIFSTVQPRPRTDTCYRPDDHSGRTSPNAQPHTALSARGKSEQNSASKPSSLRCWMSSLCVICSRQFYPRLPLRYCVQLCMTYIDHRSQIPEPYDLASFSRVENGIST